MGLLVSRFRRKKTTVQYLDELEKKIKSIEQYGYNTEQKRRRVIGTLVVFSIGIYVLTAVIFYFYIQTANWKSILIYVTPLLLFPVLVVLLRSAIAYYYEWKLNSNKTKLTQLRGEKKKILEDVMDKETYKNAKEILDKFGENNDIKPIINLNTPNKSLVPSLNATPNQLRHRQVGPVARTPINNSGMTINSLLGTTPNNRITPVGTPMNNQLPRPILSNKGGAFDRLVDYLIGDGPGSRFALICSQCTSHNGMALPEEFEYLSYRCAYCHYLNAAKKQKPKAPPLVTTPSHMQSESETVFSSTDSDESLDEKIEVTDEGIVTEEKDEVSSQQSPTPDSNDKTCDNEISKANSDD